MHAAVFKLQGGVASGLYLFGSPRWPMKVELARASIRYRCADQGRRAGVTRLQLEVDGVLSSLAIDLVVTESGSGVVEVSRNLGFIVAAHTEIRWKVASAPALLPEMISDLAITISLQAVGLETPASALTDVPFPVVWVNGSERLNLYEYDPVTLAFNEIEPGLSAGRAVITGGDDFAVTFDGGIVAARAAIEGLQCNALLDMGHASTADSPRLEFFIGATRVAALSRAGTWRVLGVTAPAGGLITGGIDRYQFRSGGVLQGVLGLPGVGLASPKFETPVA